MAELYLLAPLFNGSSEMDQVYKICSILGTPSHKTWSEGYQLASKIGLTFPQFQPVNLSSIITNANPEAISLMSEMLKFDPQKRITVPQILQHPYFVGHMPIERGLSPINGISATKQENYSSNITNNVSNNNTNTTNLTTNYLKDNSGYDRPPLHTENNTYSNRNSNAGSVIGDTSYFSNNREKSRELHYGGALGKFDQKDFGKDILNFNSVGKDLDPLRFKKAGSLNPSVVNFPQQTRPSVPYLLPNTNSANTTNFSTNPNPNIYLPKLDPLEGRLSNPTKLPTLGNVTTQPRMPDQPNYLGRVDYNSAVIGGNNHANPKYNSLGGLDSLDMLTKPSFQAPMNVGLYKPSINSINQNARHDNSFSRNLELKPQIGGGLNKGMGLGGLGRPAITDLGLEHNKLRGNLDRMGGPSNQFGERQTNMAPAVVSGFDYIGRHKF
jgi:hypothetical protein